VPTLDGGALRAALERQQSELAPIGLVLSAIATFPPRVRTEDWRGEAAEACERLEQHLHRQLRDSDAALEAAQRATRAALLELGD
jgi:hypothetical protein